MLILTSPAKSLDFYPSHAQFEHTIPQFLNQSEKIVLELQKHKKKGLEKILQISEDLAELNFYRYKHWQKTHDLNSSKPAILAYKGDIYKQFSAKNFDETQQKYIQKHLRIISGLYGILRPYDLIQPYRLEMKIPLKLGKTKNLYEFWGKTIAKNILEELEKSTPKKIVVLSSDEYAKVLENDNLKKFSIKISFRQQKGKEEFNYGIYGKKARGMMIKFMIENNITKISDITKFNLDGYKLKSESSSEIVFVKKI